MEQSEISRIITEKRKELKITKTSLSQLTGISRTQIYNIEHNLKSPSVETLTKLCNELKLEVSVAEKNGGSVTTDMK
ncbi:MAG: helix-turn-helix transcriptional regulator [Spirochaetales bacterium]|nr:helix-turn-helix transcriptional regulator [Spirochaetales bacterium]